MKTLRTRQTIHLLQKYYFSHSIE